MTFCNDPAANQRWTSDEQAILKKKKGKKKKERNKEHQKRKEKKRFTSSLFHSHPSFLLSIFPYFPSFPSFLPTHMEKTNQMEVLRFCLYHEEFFFSNLKYYFLGWRACITSRLLPKEKRKGKREACSSRVHFLPRLQAPRTTGHILPSPKCV